MDVRGVRERDISRFGDIGIVRDHRRLERRLWYLAVAVFGLGDVLTTSVGQSLGLCETNPIFRALFEVFPVVPVMVVGLGLQILLAAVVANRLDGPVRLVIPTVLSLFGVRVVLGNLVAIATVL